MLDVDLMPKHQSLLGKLLRLPLKLLPVGKAVPIIAGQTAGMKWILGSGPHSNWMGINEPGKRRLFAQMISPGDVVFDIGANVGTYSLLASRLCGSDGKVFAFEPVPVNLKYLRDHVELNRLENTIVLPYAVSDSDEPARFEPTSDRVTSKFSETGSIVVECRRLDRLVKEGEVPAPDCIKLDVEGAEAAALTGALETLRTKKPIVFLSTHGAKPEADCRAIFEALGYRMTPLEGVPNEFLVLPR